MGNFSNNAITDVGRMLLADVQSGAVFTPTRIVMGSGSMPSGATAQGMTNVITPVKSLAINKKKRTPDGKCVFGGVYTNEEVTEPFYFRELALYAKAVYLNEDGSVKSEGAETLYSYGNAGSTADYMPAYSTSTVVEKQMDLVTWVGNDAQVDLTIESGLHITHEDFDSHATRHALGGEDPITPASIGAAPAGYGLGETAGRLEGLDLNKMVKIGFYSMPGSNAVNHPTKLRYSHFGTLLVERRGGDIVHQTVRRESQFAIRYSADNGTTWGEWEYVNPQFEAGVEYRTTERRNGTVVYKMLGADGVLRYRLEGSSTWLTYAQENGAAPAGIVYKVYDTNSNEAVDAAIEAELKDMPGHSIRHICVSDNVGSTIFFGGMTHITINKVTNEYASVEAIRYHTSGVLMWKRSKYVTWLGWEWVNPTFDTGYEYRTTERYHGYAVIKKMDAVGNILWRAENETTWRLLASASNIAPANTANSPVFKDGNLVQFTILDGDIKEYIGDTGWIRIGSANIDSKSVITINEEIE